MSQNSIYYKYKCDYSMNTLVCEQQVRNAKLLEAQVEDHSILNSDRAWVVR